MSLYHPIHSQAFSVAPMMNWTDRHCRFFHRTLSKHALLYTEMVTTGAILHGQAERFLQYNQQEHPIVLQLGGCDPEALAQCSRLAQQYQYDEVNLNVGCPSDRVQNGKIGAILMAEPTLVRDCLQAMIEASSCHISVKHRIGIDELDSEQFLMDFVGTVAQSGCQTFIVHARKAILKGLSPKENREIPPLNYQRIHKLKQAFPELTFVLNGGIKDLDFGIEAGKGLDGIMLGRQAYQQPRTLLDVDSKLFAQPETQHQQVIHNSLKQIVAYIEQQHIPIKYITRHMLGLFQGVKGAKQYRRHLSEFAPSGGDDIRVLLKALSYVDIHL